MGELARGLHPAVLSERGLAAALQVLVARAPVPDPPARAAGPALQRRDRDDRLPAGGRGGSPTRRRHAHATECTLRVADGGDRLTVEVRDNGIGGATPQPGGGLECLSDRAAAIGARLELDSPRGGGTAVRLEIPVER